ncbi:MAG: hypothetical protein ACLR1T_06925 [Evtepia gabavorous]
MEISQDALLTHLRPSTITTTEKLISWLCIPLRWHRLPTPGTKSFTVDYLRESVLFKGSNSSYKFEDVATYSDLAEDDFVVYTPAKCHGATGEETFAKVETVLAGDVTATRDGEASIDGTWYNSHR